jgi:hypothetical protein
MFMVDIPILNGIINQLITDGPQNSIWKDSTESANTGASVVSLPGIYPLSTFGGNPKIASIYN